MKEKPILFSGPMVRAILEGRKTQDRRIAKLTDAGHVREPRAHRRWHPDDPEAVQACPYGQPGDRLWVREPWRSVVEADALSGREMSSAYRVWYEADTPHQPGYGRYRHARFMPRWASRITLEITGIRVERLQQISEADAIAEGVTPWGNSGKRWECPPYVENHGEGEDAESVVFDRGWTRDPRLAYRGVWESLHGPGSWDANPLVWIVQFRRMDA